MAIIKPRTHETVTIYQQQNYFIRFVTIQIKAPTLYFVSIVNKYRFLSKKSLRLMIRYQSNLHLARFISNERQSITPTYTLTSYI